MSDEGLTNPWLAGNDNSWGDIMKPRLVIINLKVIEYPYVMETFDADIKHVTMSVTVIDSKYPTCLVNWRPVLSIRVVSMETWQGVFAKLATKYTYIYINTMERRQRHRGTFPSESSMFNHDTNSYTFELNCGGSLESPNNLSDLNKKSREEWQKPTASLNNQMPNIPNMKPSSRRNRRATLTIAN